MPLSETAPAATVQHVIALLADASKPLTFAKLKTAAHLTDADLKAALDAATSQGTVFRWPDHRRSQYFWSQSPDDVAQQSVLAMAAEEALSKTKLIERASKRVPGFSQKDMQRIVVNLVAGNELQQVPAFTAGKLLVRTGSTGAYAASARKFIQEKFRKAGFDPNPFFAPDATAASPSAPTPSVDAAAQILEAIRSMELVMGVPVSAQRLRHHLPELSKHDFDAAALELRKRQDVSLSLHHDPHNLPQEERDLLVDGGDGNYYVAIAIRR